VPSRLRRSVTFCLDGLLTVLIAPVCPICDTPLDHPSRDPICDRCWADVRPFARPLCDRCGQPRTTLERGGSFASLCALCQQTAGATRTAAALEAVDRARAIGAYDGALRDIIHVLKYDARRRVAGRLGELMREHADGLLRDADLVVPVPLHRTRERQRGFNQAAALAAALGPPVRAVLRRTRATPSQAALPATDRHANVRGAFAPAPGIGEVRDRVVVLIDDVCTTGATLDACARVLKAAGACEVRALTVARVATRQR
jgi:ComF family protein